MVTCVLVEELGRGALCSNVLGLAGCMSSYELACLSNGGGDVVVFGILPGRCCAFFREPEYASVVVGGQLSNMLCFSVDLLTSDHLLSNSDP